MRSLGRVDYAKRVAAAWVKLSAEERRVFSKLILLLLAKEPRRRL
jgi:hypothetical protein